jgi:hypothetical protein
VHTIQAPFVSDTDLRRWVARRSPRAPVDRSASGCPDHEPRDLPKLRLDGLCRVLSEEPAVFAISASLACELVAVTLPFRLRERQRALAGSTRAGKRSTPEAEVRPNLSRCRSGRGPALSRDAFFLFSRSGSALALP